jgi:signal transduction histidine kinase
VAVGIVGLLALLNVRDTQNTQVDNLDPANATSYDLTVAALDQETGARGYLLTGDKSFLAPYTQARARENQAITRLRRLLAGRPELLADVSAVQADIEAWRREFAEPAIADLAAGRRPPASGLPQETLGKDRFDTLRTALDGLRNDLSAQREASRRDLSGSTDILIILFGVTLGLVVVIGVLLWAALRRWVTDPLADLGAQVREVARADMTHRIDSGGPGEIARLAVDVEDMRRRIVAEYEVSQEARRGAAEAAALIREQAEDLRRSNSELEQFAYVASHDLQEPLRKVASFCQLLQKRYGGQLDERADQYIGFAVDGAKRMQRLINDLLAFSRVGRSSASFAPVDLGQCFTAARAVFSEVIEREGGTVTAGDLPVVNGDTGLLTQLFQNLIGNGLKFHRDVPPQITVTAERDGDEWNLSCADNGIGIEPEYADRIFVIFQRLHGRDAYEGTGIGLALCKKIVEFHGGRIWLDTSAEVGTTIRWTLPARAEDAGAGSPAGSPAGTEPAIEPARG